MAESAAFASLKHESTLVTLEVDDRESRAERSWGREEIVIWRVKARVESSSYRDQGQPRSRLEMSESVVDVVEREREWPAGCAAEDE